MCVSARERVCVVRGVYSGFAGAAVIRSTETEGNTSGKNGLLVLENRRLYRVAARHFECSYQ